ncbi:hypothetical protein DU508_08140 [Pedobacter chinensis]|uniref:Uncharacterized protein n=1 Tax=Pedobacter chinensis TaxID=2282421 RepID=A0A369Q2H6_9SPHI|nr:hypothetical protein [Pedobacter chinensis]RDC57149.1 hypothetical protein DU508_08140 [Pedobacter chinensis]
MRIINTLLNPVKKFFKGMFAMSMLYAIAFLCVFAFDSCKKTDHVKDDHGVARNRFLAALDIQKQKVGSTAFGAYNLKERIKLAATSGKLMVTNPDDPNPYEPVYVNFPPGTSPESIYPIHSVNNIQQLHELLYSTDGTLQYEPTNTNSNNSLIINVQAINDAIDPVILEAKQYLYAKGFTPGDITDMIAEHNGTQQDLVPFVIGLTYAESQAPQEITRNYNPFINTANAKLNANDYINCAMVALGADIIYALSQSTLSTWSIPLMKKAFGTVAKKVLGPIGVAITVVSFGVCLYAADNH